MHTLGLCIHNVIMYDYCTHVIVCMCNVLIPIIANYTPPTQCKHPWYYLTHPTSQIFYLIWRELCEQQIVLEKLSNTMKWSTFRVSFDHELTILGWLSCFKINHLMTSNVQFGMVCINTVAYSETFWSYSPTAATEEINLCYKYRENKLQALTKMNVTYEWSNAQTRNLCHHVCHELRNR